MLDRGAFLALAFPAALIAGAKRDGAISLYAALEPRQLNDIAERFHAQYGIPVQFLRLESDKLPPRIMTEERGGLHATDVILVPGLQTDLLKQLGLLAPLRAPENSELLAGTYDPAGYWSAVIINTESIAYNPVRVRAAGLQPPRTWEDLGQPQWRGKFSLYATGYEWYSMLKRADGKDHADALLRALAANQPRLITGHTLGISLAVAGEVLVTVNTYGYSALIEKDKGSPIELVNPNPTVIENTCVSVMKDAPHPNAARLFARWLLTRDTQVWIKDTLHRAVPRKDVKNDPRLLDPKVRYVVSNNVDPATLAQDRKEFNALLGLPD